MTETERSIYTQELMTETERHASEGLWQPAKPLTFIEAERWVDPKLHWLE